MNTPGDLRHNYIAMVDWTDNSNEIILQHLNRLQNTNQLMIADAKTGAVRTILTEKDDAWIDVDDAANALARRRKTFFVDERARRLAARLYGFARRLGREIDHARKFRCDEYSGD